MDQLRKPFLFLALGLLVVVVLIEIGSGAVLSGLGTAPSPTNIAAELPAGNDAQSVQIRNAFSKTDPTQVADLANQKPPGLAIPDMALLDGVLLFTIALVASSVIVPASIEGRVQGCGTLIFAILLILAAIALIFITIGKLLLMVSLLLSIPFGTIAYLIIFGSFNRGGAEAALSLIMTLKLGFAVSLVVAQQRFLQNMGLVLIVITSLVANIIVSFLQGLVPGFLVSITDAIAGIVVAILAVIWALFLLIGALPAILNALKPP